MAQPPLFIPGETFVSAVDRIIRERKTAKILRDPEHCEATGDLAQFDEAVRACVDVAGWAPFHEEKKGDRSKSLGTIPPLDRFTLAACAAVRRLTGWRIERTPESGRHHATSN